MSDHMTTKENVEKVISARGQSSIFLPMLSDNLYCILRVQNTETVVQSTQWLHPRSHVTLMILKTKTRKSTMSPSKNAMETLRTLDSAEWLLKQLFHSGLMIQKTPLTGERYVGYYLIQRSKAKKRVLICPIEEEVPCSRSWCHAGYEQYYRLFNLQQRHPPNCRRIQHHQRNNACLAHLHLSHRLCCGTIVMGSQLGVFWSEAPFAHLFCFIYDIHAGVRCRRFVCISACLPIIQWNGCVGAHCYCRRIVCGCK